MRAVELAADRTLRVVDVPRPVPGPRDVLVRVEAVGICGSDLRVIRNGSLPPGTVLGHEFVGRVVESGDAAANPGGRVVVVPVAWCGTCAWCRRGAQQLCADMWPGSVGLGARPGAFAEFVAVDAASCRRFPDSQPAGVGALVEPFAVGLHAVRRSRRAGTPGAQAGILGAGTIGLTVLAALHLAGGDPAVVVAEPNPVRAAVARRLGATNVVSDADALGDAPLDVVFDCSGAAGTPAQVAPRLAPDGELILVGVLEPDQTYPLPGRHWVWRELDCRGSSGYSAGDFADGLAAVEDGRVDLTPMIGGRYPLAEAEQAFAVLSGPDAPAKLLLIP